MQNLNAKYIFPVRKANESQHVYEEIDSASNNYDALAWPSINQHIILSPANQKQQPFTPIHKETSASEQHERATNSYINNSDIDVSQIRPQTRHEKTHLFRRLINSRKKLVIWLVVTAVIVLCVVLAIIFIILATTSMTFFSISL